MSYPRSTVVLVFASALAFGLTACSNSSTSTPPPTSSAPAAAPAAQPAANGGATTDAGLPHPCTLLTQKDAEEVAGPGATLKHESVTDCDIQATRWDNVLGVKIEPVDLSTWDGGDTMMKMDNTAKKLSGIGESAYSFGEGNIVFKKGKAEVTVVISAYKGPKTKVDAARYIAEKIAAGL